jgi:hypothetical protein
MPQANDNEHRGYPRLEMYVGVFLTQGERAFLSELSDVSAGGARVQRPQNWQHDENGIYSLYFILDQDRILCIKGKVAHQHEDYIGFRFEPGYAIQAEQLLAESRNWR